MGGRDSDKTIKRLLGLCLSLAGGQEVTSRYIQDRYGVSRPTAQRDLLRLECALPVVVEEVLRGHAPLPQKVLRLCPRSTVLPLLRKCVA